MRNLPTVPGDLDDELDEYDTLDEALTAACAELDADGIVAIHADDCDGECEGECEPVVMMVADIMRGAKA